MKTTNIFLFLIIIFFTFILGQAAQEQTDKEIQKQRVYKYFGEGDQGEEVLYYLQTGKDTL